MESSMNRQEKFSLVRMTHYEKLLRRIEKQKEDRELAVAKAQAQRDLIKSIISVYNFLRAGLGMNQENITLEEFEGAELKLRKIAIQESGRWINWVQRLFGRFE